MKRPNGLPCTLWLAQRIAVDFPNATKVKPVDGPDVQLIPWFNIVFLIVFAAVFWAIWVVGSGFATPRLTRQRNVSVIGLPTSGIACVDAAD